MSAEFFTIGVKTHHESVLEILELDSSETVARNDVTSDLIWGAVGGGLGRLRKVRVHQRLGWTETAEGRADLKDLSELLEALAREDEEAGINVRDRVDGKLDAGVWVFDG